MKATIHINRLGEYSLRCDESGELLSRSKSLSLTYDAAQRKGYEATECQQCKDNQDLVVTREDPPFGALANWSNEPTPITPEQIREDLRKSALYMRQYFEKARATVLERAAKMKELTLECELQAIIVAALKGTTAQLIDRSDTSSLSIYSTYNEDQSVRESWAVSKQGVRELVN